MTWVLSREDRHLIVIEWPEFLELGEAFGWEPEGTVARQEWEDEWDGSYVERYGQFVEKDDAHNLSRALYNAVDAISRGEELTPEQKRWTEKMPFWSLLDGVHRIRTLAKVIEIADFAARGLFEID